MLSILVIGAGVMGKTHIRAYQAMDQAEVVGVVDVDKEKAERLAPEGTPSFSSLEEAVNLLAEIDVVDICLPTFLHKEYVDQVAKLGKHIICEKPLGKNLDEARDMIEICKFNNINLFIGHVVRFFPEYQRAKDLIEQGVIGKPGVVRTSRNSPFPKAWNNWYADYDRSGGLILDLIIHDFDFLRWCFGEVDRVYAKSLLGRGYDDKEYALVILRFKNGVIAHVEGSWSHKHFFTTFEIAGDEGILDYNSDQERPLVTTVIDQDHTASGAVVSERPLKESPYYRELQHFLDCIQTNQQPKVTQEDAYKAIEISMAALRSIELGQPITLTD